MIIYIIETINKQKSLDTKEELINFFFFVEFLISLSRATIYEIVL